MKSEAIRKVIFFHFAAIGDFLLALPALSAWRTHLPEAEFHICTRPDIGELAVAGGIFQHGVDPETHDLYRMFIPRESQPEVLGQWLSEFDFGITTSWNKDFQARLKEYIPELLAPPESPVHFSGHLQDFYLFHFLAPGIDPPQPGRSLLTLSEDVLEKGRSKLQSAGIQRPFLIHPGGGGKITWWPLQNFIEVAREAEALGMKPGWIIGPVEEDSPEFREVRGSLKYPVFSGLSLGEVAALLANAEIYLGNDSGITHLAATLGVPTIAVFGPSSPLRYGPRGKRVKVVQLDFDCSPCHPRNEHPDSQCGRDRACLKEISPGLVISALQDLGRKYG